VRLSGMMGFGLLSPSATSTPVALAATNTSSSQRLLDSSESQVLVDFGIEFAWFLISSNVLSGSSSLGKDPAESYALVTGDGCIFIGCE